MSTVQEINLSNLVPSTRNVRRTNPAEGVEELAASIAAHGLLQNLTVRMVSLPKAKKKGQVDYEVIAGGRRLAALKLLAKRKIIAKNAEIACRVLGDETDTEISLAENATQCPMHPADQFEAFEKLHREHGMTAEDIAARFGVTAAAVRQRLKLGAISPKLMQLYRDEEMNLDQLTTFCICDDHARQEEVWEKLPEWSRNREGILRALNEDGVPAIDRRAIFVGAAAYEQAGGVIARDLFDEEGSGFFVHAILLNRLAHEKLEQEAAAVRAEGWKWVKAMAEYDHGFAADLRRTWPEFAELEEADQARLDELEAEHDEIANSGMEGDEAEAELARVEAEIDRLRGPERYRPERVATGGAFVFIGHDGKPRVERGFIRPEDELAGDEEESGNGNPSTPPAEKLAPGLSEKLVADLTSHRTAGLRNALAQAPDTALLAVIHALAAEAFFHGAGNCSCLQISFKSEFLSRHAPGIDESPLGQELIERHEQWAKRMPDDAAELWGFVTALDENERLALLAHCASLTVNAVQAPGMRLASHPHADTLARAVSLDMASWWRPTVANYLGRVSKDRILEAVREGVCARNTKSLENMKKQAMAEAAEKILAGSGWLPAVLRLPEA